MARERRRVLIPADRLAQDIPLAAAEAHYLQRVLRLSSGQGCDVVDGAGRRWGARLAAGDHLELEQPLASPLEQQSRSHPLLTLAVALPRQDVDIIWRMATELGMDLLQPLQAERCVLRHRWPVERWQAILREATEQSERLWLPELAAPQTACECFADPGSGLNLLASSRSSNLPHLTTLLEHTPWTQNQSAPGGWRVCLAIGPEGGWSPAEEATAQDHGWIPVSAGPTILRTGTAAVAAAAWLAGWRARLSSSSSPEQSP